MSKNRPRVRGHFGWALWALCAGAFLAFLGYLLLQTGSAPEAAKYETLIHELAAQNFRRNSEVLLSRSGLIKHFDHLVRTERNLRDLHRRLREAPPFIDRADREHISRALRQSDELRAQAEWMVEDFKRQLAVLSNSSGFVATLSRDSHVAVAAMPGDWQLTQLLNEALRHLLTLEVTHDPEVARAAQKSLHALEIASRGASSNWTDLHLIVHHGNIIIGKSILVDELTRRLTALPHQQATDTLLREYLRAQDRAVRTQHRQRSALSALFFLLGFVVALAIIQRLSRSARALAASGAELEQAVESLKLERNKQVELAELKSRFVSTTSHEFRTPLSVILSSAEMLTAYADVWNQERKEQHLVRIRSAALSMTRMLEDVLLLGRAESGRLSFAPAPLKICELCHDVASLAEQASGHAGRIQTHCENDNSTVHADETLLRHILGNLLSNALKYSANGSPVHLSANIAGGALRFIVQDDGIGIPEDDQRHLFDSFHRGSNVGRVTGTGLGLTIVKRALDLQSGEITIDSKLGQGTTIHVHIPLKEAAE